jgi:L-asparaginase
MIKPKVHILVLGGTITMVPKPEGGIAPSLSGTDLIAAVPALRDIAEISVSTPFLVPGASLSLAQMREVDEGIREAFAAGADGVVVAQGTDTIDETSFLLDLVHDHARPVVVTGAMRGAAAPGADGHANLWASVITAAAPEAAGLGVLVVLNDEIHAARYVEKMHKGLTSAFASPGYGPLGHVMEGVARIALRPTRLAAMTMVPSARIAVVKAHLGDDDTLVAAIPDLGFEGLIIEGMGAGHIPSALVGACARAAEAMPVVLASRVPAGPIFQHTYGFPGSEIDLIGRGLIAAGTLSAAKARLLLGLLVGAKADRAAIAAAFSAYY